MDVNQIKLEQPLFYNAPYGLRFEIGSSDVEIWTDFDKGCLNNGYFKAALRRAIAIFETAFSGNDQISIVYQLFSDGRRKIWKGSYLFKQITHLNTRDIKFSARRDLYAQDLYFRCHCWRRAQISQITVQDINYRNILKAISHTDFSRIRSPAIQGEVYFVNHTKDLILLFYDDRGMDIVSLQKAPLIPIYIKHNKWILDSNRQKIEKVFSEICNESPES